MGCGTVQCSSPRCKESLGTRCNKHSHNYSWYCKYCKQEEEDQIKSEQRRIEENQQRLRECEQESLRKKIADKEMDIRWQEIARKERMMRDGHL